MRIQPHTLRKLYLLAQAPEVNEDLITKLLSRIAPHLYEVALVLCTYEYGDKRYFKSGGTLALAEALNAFVALVQEYEHGGTITLLTLDALLWACHNNGTFADKFIAVDGESEAMVLLNELGGISR